MPTLQEWRSYYDTWAGRDPRLASTGRVVPDADFDRLADVLRRWTGPTGGERALDVGCASGTLTTRWARHVAHCTGIDFSPGLIAEAQRRHGGGNCTFEVAEAAVLPFADASFDLVICYDVLLSLPDHAYVDRAIAEILRVARPTARIVLGSLPDQRRQERFFEVLQTGRPWYRRLLSRAKRWLRSGRPRPTQILWFDIDALRRRCERAGFRVELHDDPPFENYRYYRRSLVLSRDEAGR
jgi:ubiquinone/menaquinone biosynthesis C-methylase UbiE